MDYKGTVLCPSHDPSLPTVESGLERTAVSNEKLADNCDGKNEKKH